MGITKALFTGNITLPCTIREQVTGADGESVQTVDHAGRFTLRRQTQKEADELAAQNLTANESADTLRLKRLALLLVDPPEGFDDFPTDERPLGDRVMEYFTGDEMAGVVRTVLLQYDRALYPVELFRAI